MYTCQCYHYFSYSLPPSCVILHENEKASFRTSFLPSYIRLFLFFLDNNLGCREFFDGKLSRRQEEQNVTFFFFSPQKATVKYRFSIVWRGGPRSPSTKVVLKFRVGAEGGSVKGGPFYRGQTENALFIGRSRLAIHRIPAKSERVEAEGCVGGVTQAAGMKLTGGEGGVKWHLFPSPFAHSHAYTRVYIYIRIPRLERNESFDRFLVNFFPSSRLIVRVHPFLKSNIQPIYMSPFYTRPIFPDNWLSLIQTFSLYPENKWFVSFRGTNCGW